MGGFGTLNWHLFESGTTQTTGYMMAKKTKEAGWGADARLRPKSLEPARKEGRGILSTSQNPSDGLGALPCHTENTLKASRK